MGETSADPKPIVIELPAPEGMRLEQTSTRGDGTVELGEVFPSGTIDFSRATDHLRIHTEGTVAGSQFDGEAFATPQAVVDGMRAVLPESLQFDQHGRVELTVTAEGGRRVGHSNVKSLQELKEIGGVRLERSMRTPGGEPAEVDGIQGAWYPEMARSPDGKFEVATNSDGSVKNLHGKFEPEAWIAHVDAASFAEASATDKATVIIQKDQQAGTPTALTIFPGENAPAFPAQISTEAYQANTLQGGPEAAYWHEHAFVQTS